MYTWCYVYTMKRKTVLHGQSTLTVSLPSEWVKKFNVGKGDELNLYIRARTVHTNHKIRVKYHTLML